MTSCFQLGFSAKRWHPFSPASGSENNWTTALLGCVCLAMNVGVKAIQREERKVACAFVHIFPSIIVRPPKEMRKRSRTACIYVPMCDCVCLFYPQKGRTTTTTKVQACE